MTAASRQTVAGPRPGAHPLGGGRCRVHVWAPRARPVHLHLVAPRDRLVPLPALGAGWFGADVEEAPPGTRYRYRLDEGAEYPDPASRSQPEGVHGPSEVVGHEFPWTDEGWRGVPLTGLVIYELHVGTFTRAGTFEAVIPHLAALRQLGVTAIELMPVAQFPGARNWGYDGVYPFAVQQSYGGPDGLRRLVDAAHAAGLAVLLDVVYNHLGPEGNYLGQFGPYFTDRYRTPWGEAVNFDGPDAGPVRQFVVENAVQWVADFHLDGLRLDAVHSIHDASPRHVLTEIVDAVVAAAPGRHVHVIAESDENDARLVAPAARGGRGVHAQWSDDFHHALHALLTGERAGYYQDFGELRHLSAAIQDGFVYTGQRSPFRGRPHGTSPRDIEGAQLVVCAQNHDQVGNRMLGERLGHLVSFEHQKLAAAALLAAPNVPLLFMGQEYGEVAPFLYFVSHSDPHLVDAVRRGRREEFAAFAWQGEVPDPQTEETFRRSTLDHARAATAPHRQLRAFYEAVLRLRREVPALATLDKARCEARCLEAGRTLIVRRWAGASEVVVALCFAPAPVTVAVPVTPGRWRCLLDSAATRWAGPGGASLDVLDATGALALTLAPGQALVLERVTNSGR